MTHVTIALALMICTMQIFATERPRAAKSLPPAPQKQSMAHQVAGNGSPKSQARTAAILKKIAAQQRFLEWTNKEAQKAQASRKQLAPGGADTLRQAKLLGKRIPFLAAPAMPARTQSRLAKTAAVSDLRINGKSSDTVITGGKMNLTFSFAPGFISAVLSVYYDADHNGILSAGDPVVNSGILLMDGDEHDSDPAPGRESVALDGIFSTLIGPYILAVDDFQSVSSVLLVVRERPSSSILHISTIPPLSLMLVTISENGTTRARLFTDSTGAADVLIDRFTSPWLDVRVSDDLGHAGSYLPPPSKSVPLAGDTTSVVFTFRPAPSVIRGFVLDDHGTPVRGALVWAARGSYPTAWTHMKTDSIGAFLFGADSLYWSLQADPPSSEFLKSSTHAYVYVAPNSINDVRLTLHKANSSISGSVQYSQTGVGGVLISANADTLSNEVLTGANGLYTLPVWQPPTGPIMYTVTPRAGEYIYTLDTVLQVASGTSNLNFSLTKASGGIQGKVTDDRTGFPIAGAQIQVGTSRCTTDDSGRYYTPLHDGGFQIFADARGHFSYLSQSSIVVAGSVVTFDFSMSQCGIISGIVCDKSGHPIPYANVSAHDSLYINYGSASADPSGKFEIDKLKTGSYIVSTWAAPYLSMYFPNTADPLQAVYVSATEGQETPNIDFTLPLGGSITGKVTDRGGLPIPVAFIAVYDTLYTARGGGMTDENGHYQAGGLPTGDYRVMASGFPYASTWYDDAPTFESASTVHVVREQTTSGINFSLPKGAEVSGYVRSDGGKALAYATVAIYDTLSRTNQWSSTNDSGWYHIIGIPPGVYKVGLASETSAWLPQWFNHKDSFETADTIHLQLEQTRTGIDFDLTLASGIYGSVVDSSSGSGLSWASVYVVDENGGERFLLTDGKGFYGGPFSAGHRYSVVAEYEDTNHASRYYYSSHGGRLIRREAEEVTIANDTSLRTIDFSIPTDRKTTICHGSNLETTITNRGQFGSKGDTTKPSCRWPNSQGKNLLFESDFWFGCKVNPTLHQFGDFYNTATERWHAATNFLESAVQEHAEVQTAFYGKYYYAVLGIGLNIVVRQVVDSWPNTDFVISKQVVHYDALSPYLPQMSEVYSGWFADFNVSQNGKSDLVGIDSVNSLIYVYRSEEGDSTHVGLCMLGHVNARLTWWDESNDTALQTESARYNLMATKPGFWLPSVPRDYRVLVSTALPAMNAGDSVTVAVAYVAGKGREGIIAAAQAARMKYDLFTNGVPANGSSALPQGFSLSQNYPNPFNPVTQIKYTVAGTKGQASGASDVSLIVYDVLGRQVAVLVNEKTGPGSYIVKFDGRELASGVYFYRMQAGSFVETKKLLLIR